MPWSMDVPPLESSRFSASDILAQCFHSGFLEVPRLCSKKSQVGVKNPKLIKNENKVMQQAFEQ